MAKSVHRQILENSKSSNHELASIPSNIAYSWLMSNAMSFKQFNRFLKAKETMGKVESYEDGFKEAMEIVNGEINA